MGVQWLECEADCPPPASFKLGNEWGYTSIPPYATVGRAGTIVTVYLPGADTVLQNGYWDVDAYIASLCLCKCLCHS